MKRMLTVVLLLGLAITVAYAQQGPAPQDEYTLREDVDLQEPPPLDLVEELFRSQQQVDDNSICTSSYTGKSEVRRKWARLKSCTCDYIASMKKYRCVKTYKVKYHTCYEKLMVCKDQDGRIISRKTLWSCSAPSWTTTETYSYYSYTDSC